MKVLLSIKPRFVDEILKGTKKFEYRKKVFKKDVDTVIIYSTRPVGRIIGEFTIDKILNDSPKELWKETSSASGITEEFFNEYFDGRDEGFAIKIKDFIEYENPIDPKVVFEKFVAPQSYKYMREDDLSLMGV